MGKGIHAHVHTHTHTHAVIFNFSKYPISLTINLYDADSFPRIPRLFFPEKELVDRSTPFAISYYSCYPYPGGIARPMRSGFSQPRAQTEQRLKNVVCGVRPGPYPCAVRRPVDTYRERKMVDTRIDGFLRLSSAKGESGQPWSREVDNSKPKNYSE